MAKGLSDDEIMKFIKSKDVSSKDYKAPKTKITKVDLSRIKTDNVRNTKTDNSVKNKVLRRTLVNTKPDNSNKKINQTIYNKNAVRTSQKPEPKSIGSIDIVRNQSELRKTQDELQRQREKRLNPEGKNAAVETVKQAKQAMRAVEKVGEKEARNLIDFSTNAYDYAKAIKNKDDKKEAEAVSNMANAFDKSLVGRGIKTAGNFATRTGHGALKGADWMLDWGIDKATSKPLQYARFAEKLLNPDKKEKIDKKYDTIQNYIDDYTKQDLADITFKELGWDEDAYRTWEKGSLVNRNNIGGQVAETMGEQFLPLMLGSEISSNLVGNSIGNKFAGTKLSKATAGLTGADKYLTGLKTAGKNAAKYFIKNAPSLMPFWTTSYGGALEEALNEGATREEARRYATLNAAVEAGTEMMFDGIPAIKGSSSTADAIANGLIDKATGKITNKFAKQIVSYLARMGYVGAGEGAEEIVSEILNPALKNATYSNGEKIDWKQVLQSGMMGFISGEVMGAQNTFEESRNAVNNQINRETFQNSIQNTVNNAAQTTSQEIASQLDQLAQQRVQQIDQAVRQGQMTAQEGTQEIEDIQRYVDAQKNTLQQEQQPQQNQNNRLAQQAVQQINQQVQSGQISPQDGIQQIEDIQNYLRAQETQTQQSGNLVEDYMNDNYESLVGDYIDQTYGQQTQQDNINAQEEQNVVQNVNNEVKEKQDYEGLNQKEYNEIQRRYKELMETTGFEEDLMENATPSEIIKQLKTIKEIAYEGDGFLEQARDEGPEIYKQTKSQYDKINRLINRFENKIGQQKQQNVVQNANNEAEQKPRNVGIHYGDLGKARDTYYWDINSSNRSTGHYGTGTYFLSEQESKRMQDSPFFSRKDRAKNEVDFNDYNLYKPLIESEARTLHDGLKAINYNNYDDFDYRSMVDDLKRHGITQEQIDNAKNVVEETRKKYKNEGYNDKYDAKMDSLSTVFMKALGYEGIDVRELEGYDNTSYGSVIYDLKNKQNQNNVEKATQQEQTNLKQQESNLVEDYMNNGEDNLVNDYMNNYEYGNMVENYMNTQNNQAQTQQNAKDQTNAFNLGEQEQSNIVKQNEIKSKNKSSNMFSTVAPYYSKQVNDANYQDVKQGIDSKFNENAQKIANNLGIKIDNIQDNVGGYDFDDGKGHVDEISYTYQLGENTSKEDAKMFGCLLGDIGNETQETIIVGNYTNSDNSDANLEYTLKLDSDDGIIELLKEVGIKNYTFNKSTNELQLLLFKEENGNFNEQEITDKFERLAEKLGGRVSEPTKTYIESELVESEDRQNLYETWLESNRETKNRELYNQVQQAYEKVKEFNNQGTSDSSFSNEKANIPETKNEQSIKIELTGVPKNQIKTENTGISIGNKPVQIEVPINSSQNKLGQYVPKDGFTKEELKNGKIGDSKFYKNVTERADFISDEVRERVQSDDYIKHHRKITNDESMQMAFEDLNTRGTEAIADFFNNDKELTSKDTAMGWLLIEQSQANGDYNFSNQVLRKMRSSATKTGQAMQMYNYYARLTPEGMYRWCGDQLLRAEEIFEKNKTKKWIEANKNRWQLNSEEVGFIKDQMEKVQKLNKMNDSDTTTIDIKGKAKKVTVDRAKQVEIAKIQAMIEDKIPHQKGQALNAWMRISMLGNLKTIGTRNPLGNIALRPVNDVGDFVSSLVDYAISKKTGVRTKGKLNIKAQAKGFKKGSSEAVQDFRLGIDTKNQKGNRFEIGQGKSFNEKHTGAAELLNPLSKVGNKADSGVSFLLDLGDRPFYEAAYEQSLENQMKLNGVEKAEDASEWMKKIAEQEALERTYQDDNNYTAAVVEIRKAMNRFNVKGYGLGDVIIPFAKTPANLTKAIVDYSPAGFVSALTKGNELRTAINNEQFTPEMQHRFVNQLGKATAGTILYAIGAAFANSGLITGGADDDDDVADFMRNTLGIQPYSIKIGDKSFTYDWAQPVASAFAIPADIKKGIQDAKNQEVDLQYIIHKSFSTAGNILLEQSFLQGIKDVLGGYGDPLDNLMSEIEGLPARAVPTLFQQMVTYLDPTKRMSYGNKGIQNVISQAIAKTPFAKDLPAYRNTMGKEVKMYGGKNSFFNVFINPSNYSEGNATKSAEEIYAIYQATNDKAILPRTVGSDLRNEDGTKLTNQQKSDFLKISGDFIDKNVEKLTESNEYKNMSNEDKAATIKYIVDYAYNKARKEITGHKLSSEHQKTENAEKSGYAMADYFISKKTNKVKTSKSTKSRNRYKELQEKGIDGRTFDDFVSFVKKTKGDSRKGGLSKKEKVINYIEGLNLSKQAKEALYEDYKKNQKTFTVYN